MTAKTYALVYPPPTQIPKQVRPRRWKPKGSFPFFSLPVEIRLLILQDLLALPADHVIDYDPTNPRNIRRRLDIFLTCRRMHAEAYPIFYGMNAFRLFPTHREFTKMPTIISRLSPRYRACIQHLEMRLGPGWADPPSSWTLGYGRSRDKWRKKDKSGMEDCTSLQQLRVFVELDPSHPVFDGFRIDEHFYTQFCGELLKRALSMAPVLKTVIFDGYESVKLEAPLMTELLSQVRAAGKSISYGPDRGWADSPSIVALSPPATAPSTIYATPQDLEIRLAAVSLQA